MRIFLLLLLGLIISGCQVPQPDPAADLPDLTHVEIAEASIAVSKSLDDLAALSAERAVIRVEPETQEQLDYGLTQLASIDWNGPAEPLIRRLAQAVDYHFRVIGKPPVHIVIVDIDKHDVSVGELFRDIALQVQRDADLVIYPQSKLVELHYASAFVKAYE